MATTARMEKFHAPTACRSEGTKSGKGVFGFSLIWAKARALRYLQLEQVSRRFVYAELRRTE